MGNLFDLDFEVCRNVTRNNKSIRENQCYMYFIGYIAKFKIDKA